MRRHCFSNQRCTRATKPCGSGSNSSVWWCREIRRSPALRLRSAPRMARPDIVEDAVVFGQQQQYRRLHIFGDETQKAVEAHALDQEARRRLVQAERVVAQKLLPARVGREQLRLVERDRKQPARRDAAAPDRIRRFSRRDVRTTGKKPGQSNSKPSTSSR